MNQKTKIQKEGLRFKGSSGDLYTGTIDCLWKTTKSEGIISLYKGFVPTFLRMGPYTVLTLLFYEQLTKVALFLKEEYKSFAR